jgi:isopentenyl diphosphate isomerase/L-lactate dehydrogenase-like FMN-dependent dehydrogenase
MKQPLRVFTASLQAGGYRTSSSSTSMKGVAHTLRLLEAEMRSAMALTGTVSVTKINANIPRSAVEFNRGG